MCESTFSQLCKAGRFYYFESLEDFEKKIDWDGRDVSKLSFKGGLKKNTENQVPENMYYSYGVDPKKEKNILEKYANPPNRDE